MSYSNLLRCILCISLSFLCGILSAQTPCECTNCPVPITDNGTFDAELNVQTTGPNNLGICPLQRVCFEIDHTYVGDLFATLQTPSGLEYFIMADGGNNTGECGTSSDNINVCVELGTTNPLTNNADYLCNGVNPCLNGNWTVPCGGISSALTTATEAPGCDLDAFNVSGDPINGLWVLSVTDVCGEDEGFLVNWSLEFACGELNCFTCAPDGGALNQPDVEACRFEPELIQNPFPVYGNPLDMPDPIDYGYAYVVVDDSNGEIMNIVPTVNLLSADPGTYTVCGLSYYLTDFGEALSFVGQQYTALVADLDSGTSSFCGDLSDNCYSVTVLQDSPVTEVDADICLGDCYDLWVYQFCAPGVYTVDLENEDGCDSTIILNLGLLPQYNEVVDEVVCEGDSIYMGDYVIGPGSTTITYTAQNGCDSNILVVVTEILVESGIDPLIPGHDSISCSNPIVNVQGTGSADGSFAWYNADGVLVGTDENLDVLEAGCYDLVVTRESAEYYCTDTSSVCIGEIIPDIPVPILDGETFLCVGDTIEYSIANIDLSYTDYEWLLPEDVLILQGGNGFPSVQIVWNSIFTGDICVKADTDCGFSEEVCLDISFEFELESPVINGEDLVCYGDTVTYSATVTGANEFFWSINGGSILSGQMTDEVQVLWDISGGSLCASGISYCGTGPQSCIDVSSNFVPSIASITGVDTLCAGASSVYTVSLDNNTDSIFWDVPACVQILSGQFTDTVELLWPEGCASGAVCVETYNVCGAGVTDCLPVEVIQVPSFDPIAGPIEVCPGTYNYTINPVMGAIDYQWTITGATVSSGQGTNQVELILDTEGIFDLCVDILTDCHLVEPSCLEIEVLGSIDVPQLQGDVLVCPDATVEYSVVNIDPLVDSYTWSSSCGVITGSPLDGPSVSVDWTGCSSGSEICLTLTGICGETETTCLTVDMIVIPSAPVVSAPAEVCSMDTITLSANNSEPDVIEYLWNIPACATILSGQGSNEIELVFSNTCNLEEVCVSAANNCDFGPEACVEIVVNTPPLVGDILGETVVCLDTEYSYSIPPIAEAIDYVWTANGADILSGAGSDSIVVEWTQAGAQVVYLEIVTDCGTIPVSAIDVFVQLNMATPAIVGDAIVCDSTENTYTLDVGIPEALGYTWSSTCATIIEGQGTDMIKVDWTGCQNGGQICVIANGACDDSPEVCFDVDGITNPELPLLSGVAESCEGTVDQYCTVSNGADQFNWTVLGGLIISGNGTDCIDIEWTLEGTGQVCVQTQNTCGLSPQVCMDVLVDGLPDLPVILGTNQTCIVTDQVFELETLESDIIQIDWSVSSSIGQIDAGQGTEQITINWIGSGDAQICVAVENECGISSSCVEVEVIDMPIPNAGEDDVICGLTYALSGLGGDGIISWSQVSGTGTASFATPNSFDTEVEVDQTGLYVFELEINDSGCISVDQVEIRFDEIPVLGQVTPAVCDDTADNYTISIEVLNGTAPYTAIGLNGNWVGNIFYSDPISSGEDYAVEIYDVNSCGPVSVNGSHTCPCISDAGTYMSEHIDLCGLETFEIEVTLDATLDGNDALRYFILSELPAPNITQDIVMDVNEDGMISFVNGMLYDQTYYVYVVVGDELMGSVDIQDPCLSIAEIMSFTYSQIPTASFQLIEPSHCEGNLVNIVFAVENDACVDIVLADGTGNNSTHVCISDGDELTVGPYTPGDYMIEILEVVGQTCQGLAGPAFPITVNEIPELDVIQNTEVCNSTDSGNPTTFNLEDLILVGDASLVWENLDDCPVSGTMPNLDFEGVAAGDYTFRVSTSSAIDPCPDVSLEFVVTVLDCTCPNLDVNLPPAYCNSMASVDLTSFLADETVSVIWTIDTEPTVGQFDQASINGSLLEMTGSAPGVYTLGLTFDGVAPVGCVLENSLDVQLSNQLESGSALAQLSYCEGTEELIDLSTILQGADLFGAWSEVSDNPSTGGGFDGSSGMFEIDNEASGLYKFEYLLDSEAPCVDESTVVEVLINPLPVAEIEEFDTITCVNLEVELTAYREDNYVFEWADQSDLNIVIGTNSSLVVTESGDFQLQVVDSLTGCVSSETINIPAYLEVPIPEVEITDVNCFGYSNGNLSITNIEGGVGPYSVSFDEGDFSDILIFSGLSAGDYQLAIEDVYGCVSNASVTIEEPEPMEVFIDPMFAVGSDDILDYGDSLQVLSNINVPMDVIDSIRWTPTELVECDTCLDNWLYPFETTNFTIQVHAGNCSTSDLLSVFVQKEHLVFLPNVINSDSGDNILFVRANYMAESVKYLKVFDRWGGLVYENYNFLPNDPSEGWDGQLNGRDVESGTYIYVTEVQFIDGHTEIFKGDVSIIK